MQTPNKPKQTRRKFDQEFKTEALRMVAEGQVACVVARSLNVSQKLIYRWNREQKKQVGKQKAVKADEIDQLKAQLKRVEMERDILKSTARRPGHHLWPTDLTIMYQFVKKHSQEYPVSVLCEVVGVSRSAYYAYAIGQTYQSAPAKKQQEAAVEALFVEHKRRYGSRRLVKALQAKGEKTGRSLVRKVLAKRGLSAIQPRSFVPPTTDSRHRFGFSPNLLLNADTPSGPNQVWVSDITYIALTNGRWAYLATWMDRWSRLIVGWHLDETMEEALVLTAFRRAALGRQPEPGLIAHSDRGGQYAGKAFRRLLASYGCRQSMSRAAPRWPTIPTTMPSPSPIGLV